MNLRVLPGVMSKSDVRHPEVYEPLVGRAVAVVEDDRALEDVSVLLVVGLRGRGALDARKIAQLSEEGLKVRPLGRPRLFPTRDELLD